MAGAVAALLTFLGMTMAGPGQDTRVEGQSDDISIATTAPNLR
jgi:hypothetical protein